jgi:hypothetical protein
MSPAADAGLASQHGELRACRLDDGKCLFGGENIRTYPVDVREGYVYVDVTDPAPEEIAPAQLR